MLDFPIIFEIFHRRHSSSDILKWFKYDFCLVLSITITQKK